MGKLLNKSIITSLKKLCSKLPIFVRKQKKEKLFLSKANFYQINLIKHLERLQNLKTISPSELIKLKELKEQLLTDPIAVNYFSDLAELENFYNQVCNYLDFLQEDETKTLDKYTSFS